jgi:hypothetical protein
VSTETFLPATPAIRRLTIAYLCAKPPRYPFLWWPDGWQDAADQQALPLHVPAGLAIAQQRLGEIAAIHGWAKVDRWADGRDAAAVVRALRALDPEPAEVARADR